MSDLIPSEEQKARRRRNVALAGALVLFVVLVFIVTVVKMGVNAQAVVG